jgi:hypothetical protein
MEKIKMIPDAELPKCSSCTGCWDSLTGIYCRYDRKPDECEGPK